MGIFVIDIGPELYWYVSTALLQDEIPLKHLQSIQVAEKEILQELPLIVILNGDDKTLLPDTFINKMRNQVFARNTLFIVVTSDSSAEFKKSLLIAGAAQILYGGVGYNPSPKFLAALVKWFKNTKTPDPQIFDFKPVPFLFEAEFTTYGRIGWISSTQCMIEANIDLNVGQSIEIKNPLFEELGIKNVKLECVEKNKVGRYYQYANSILCKITSKDMLKDPKKLEAWMLNNNDISKHKPVKIVYIESDADYRDTIKKIIKMDKRYCARGFANLDDFQNVLDSEIPHLILINRALIQKDKAKFEPIKNCVKNNFCYCVTYATNELFSVEEFKKNYEFAMHSQGPIELDLLESMIQKLEVKMPNELKTDDKKIYLNKHSPYSRLSLHAPCKLTELSLNGVGIELPFNLNNYCACEISSNAFTIANLGRTHFFRSFMSKSSTASSRGNYHRLICVGQTIKDSQLVKEAVELIAEFGHDRWSKGDTKV